MLEQQGRVVAVEHGAVLVQVERQSACGSCQARAACGQGLAQMTRSSSCHQVRALTDLSLQVGDTVVLGVSEELMLRSAFMVYLLPLLALLGGAGVASWLELSEPMVILLALTGFVGALVFLRNFNQRNLDNASLVPIVLRAELNTV